MSEPQARRYNNSPQLAGSTRSLMSRNDTALPCSCSKMWPSAHSPKPGFCELAQGHGGAGTPASPRRIQNFSPLSQCSTCRPRETSARGSIPPPDWGWLFGPAGTKS